MKDIAEIDKQLLQQLGAVQAVQQRQWDVDLKGIGFVQILVRFPFKNAIIVPGDELRDRRLSIWFSSPVLAPERAGVLRVVFRHELRQCLIDVGWRQLAERCRPIWRVCIPAIIKVEREILPDTSKRFDHPRRRREGPVRRNEEHQRKADATCDIFLAANRHHGGDGLHDLGRVEIEFVHAQRPPA